MFFACTSKANMCGLHPLILHFPTPSLPHPMTQQNEAAAVLNRSNKLMYIHSFIHSFIHSYIHSAVCLKTRPQPLPKRVLHRMRTGASGFNFQYSDISLRSSSSCLRLIPCLHITSIPPSIFPSYAIQLAFLLFILCKIFLSSLTLCNSSLFLT